LEPVRPNRDEIPKGILEQTLKLELEGLVALHTENFSNAKELFQKQYDVLFKEQTPEDRPIHKGAPLHNLGLALFYLRDIDRSIYHFLLAYVEDTLNTRYDFEDDADRAPAATILRDVFIFRLKILSEIKLASLQTKKDGNWNDARDPKEILSIAARKLKLDLEKLSALCGRIPELGKMVVGFPQPREMRVFIGTNYDVNIGVIPLVKEGIYRKFLTTGRRYWPVTVLDVVIPPNATHDISLLLLHTCAYAIIDVSHPGGQFVEIERARDYGVQVFLVRQAARPIDPARPPHISEMISTLGYSITYYFDPRELITITQNVLP
jgi:hypothetical protein